MEDVVVVGSGMGALTAAALLAKEGLQPLIIEQNWIPGGCTTSYWRKGFVFEAGATTLVGLDEHMPLRHLLEQTGIELPVRKLELPMQVHLKDGRTINRHQDINDWIEEAEHHFGGNQKAFWKAAYELSQWVWESSTRFKHFPPSSANELIKLATKARPNDVWNARNAFSRTTDILKKHQLTGDTFKQFVDEQLLITAQNKAEEVNFLFGAAALCYTNYGNYYIDGGLQNLVQPIIKYIEQKGGKIIYREGVKSISKKDINYKIRTTKNSYQARKVVSGIPINNLKELAPDLLPKALDKKILGPNKLYSAFQMGIAFRSNKEFESLHHQIHLDKPMAETHSNSIFVSLSHPEDVSRSDENGVRVASISTHISDPKTFIDSQKAEESVVQTMIDKGIIKSSSDILYSHSSGPKSWQKWTGRAHGFVGGFPQYFDIKPWQMINAKIAEGLYSCGDTNYPGQGIPGVTLSGIIAAQKILDEL